MPLFFVGYALLRTRKRLRTFFVIMLVIATANGVVGMIQLNLTPAQLSSWGPGYAFRINNEGTGLDAVSGRTFNTSTGVARTRPFGLGDDAGSGEAWGMLALGGALALMALGIRKSVGQAVAAPVRRAAARDHQRRGSRAVNRVPCRSVRVRVLCDNAETPDPDSRRR